MNRKITLSIDEDIYRKLHFLIPKRKLSKFVEESIAEKISQLDLESDVINGYKAMGKDAVREEEACEWADFGFGENNEM